MAKYLDSTGVSTLWSKCKSTFLTQSSFLSKGGGDYLGKSYNKL